MRLTHATLLLSGFLGCGALGYAASTILPPNASRTGTASALRKSAMAAPGAQDPCSNYTQVSLSATGVGSPDWKSLFQMRTFATAKPGEVGDRFVMIIAATVRDGDYLGINSTLRFASEIGSEPLQCQGLNHRITVIPNKPWSEVDFRVKDDFAYFFEERSDNPCANSGK